MGNCNRARRADTRSPRRKPSFAAMAPTTALSFVLRSSASFLSRSFLAAQQSFDGCSAAATSGWHQLQDDTADSRSGSQTAPPLRRDARGQPLPMRGAHGGGCAGTHGCILLAAYAAAAAMYLAARVALGHGAWPWLSWCLLLGEIGFVTRVVHHGLHFVRRPQTYMAQADLLYTNRYSFHVVVLIPCANEPLQLVAPTVLAAAAAALPPGCTKEVWLCDDGQDAAKAAWVAGLEIKDVPVHYSTGRPQRPGRNGKSCNMNWALQEHIYPNYPDEDVPNHHVLCFFDADQACVPNFFLLTLPYLVSARDALVQCPQTFANYFPDADVLDHSARLKWVCRQAMVRGLGGLHCNGSGLVVRARALARIGWWADWTVCEDNMMAMQLQRRGYRGYFVNMRVAYGQVPETVADSFKQRARFIMGYITNTISRRGMCWDTAHPLLLRILGNALTRDLFIIYMPLLLLPPVLGLLAMPAGCSGAAAGEEQVAVAAGFAYHPLLPWAWLAHYLVAQVVLQWHVLEAFGTSVWINWLSHLFATHHFWPLTIACFAQVLHADFIRRQPLEFSITPKRAALAAALEGLHTSGDLGEETADDLDGVRAASPAEHLQALQSGILLQGSFCSVHAGRGEKGAAPGDKAVVGGGGSVGELLVDATADAASPSSCTPPDAGWSSEPSAAAAYVYDGCPGDATFPWRWVWVHVLVLLGSVAAAGKGAWLLATQPSCGFAGQPTVVVQVVWCLHNSMAPAMLLARALHGDSPALRSACWLLPRVMVATGCMTWLWLVL